MGLPQWLSNEDSTCNVGKAGSISGSGRSPGGGNGNPLSILAGGSQGQGNLVGYSPWGHKESDTTEAAEHI